MSPNRSTSAININVFNSLIKRLRLSGLSRCPAACIYKRKGIARPPPGWSSRLLPPSPPASPVLMFQTSNSQTWPFGPAQWRAGEHFVVSPDEGPLVDAVTLSVIIFLRIRRMLIPQLSRLSQTSNCFQGPWEQLPTSRIEDPPEV